MGTTLTGTTPQDTYDSLIKVTDNGPISGTAKFLSDGLGNDSVLALSTSKVLIGNTGVSAINETLNVTGAGIAIEQTDGGVTTMLGAFGSADTILGAFTNNDVVLRTNNVEKMRITSAGNVGIGTSAPSGKLSVGGTQGSTLGSNVALLLGNVGAAATVGNLFQIGLHYNPIGSTISTIIGSVITSGASFTKSDIFFATRDVTTDTAPTERVRILSSGGITFNGDTAAANALDDYEEGTWTMGVSFGGASVGVTTSSNTGSYTKIGRQVTVNGYLILTSKGSSTGAAVLTGLPFTIANSNSNYSAATYWLINVSSANQIQGNGSINTTVISFDDRSTVGTVSSPTNTNFANDSGVIVSFTYFV